MKISNSKKELARIISENGGWRDGAGYLAMDTSGMVCGYLSAPKWSSSLREWTGSACFRIFISTTLAPNHQRTILSSEEYFHLYPAPTAKPSIEQLATDYRNRKDYADRKQQEAYAAKADAEVKLAEMVAAGKAIGLVLSVEHEVSAITPALPQLIAGDWRSWRQWEVGDLISWSIVGHAGEFRIISVHHDPSRNIGDFEVEDKQGGVYRVYGNECRFIRRP